ncbi:KHG/KDPG aldolase [Leminorella grimontii]|nr:KHG/KDPG aldolase [Leminorella grimontii]
MKSWKKTAEQILTLGPVVPVIVINDIKDAVPLAKALVAGGVKTLEVTLRTACALDAIRKIMAEVPEAVVGAGTVTTVEQYKKGGRTGAWNLSSRRG